jgi:2TM family of unknown function (DUF5676)
MKLNVRAVCLATGLVSAASYAICALMVALRPERTSRSFGYVLHIDLSSLTRSITWPSFFVGLFVFCVVVAAHAAAAAWFYNRLTRSQN